jgi:hypothetical protein
MTPALARIKRACRAAIGHCGGVDGAGATAGRSRSVAGDWNNRNAAIFPPLDCVLALDEVSMSCGHRPELLHALAGELGLAVIALPQATGEADSLAMLLIDVVTETGELADKVRCALADGVVGGLEPVEIEREADELMERVALIRAHARLLQGKDAAVQTGGGK